MKNLSNEELKQINGGGIRIGFMIAMGAGIAFFIGLIDGLVRPLKCH